MIDLMIIGVDKAGTTALYRHLALSDRVCAHEQREMFFFQSDSEYAKGWDFARKKYFEGRSEGLIVAKNVMQINSDKAMKRLKEQCPGVKCVVMLREPASRAYSAYHYARLRGVEDRKSFEDALDAEDVRYHDDPDYWAPTLYLRNSTYANRLRSSFAIYGRENVLVVLHEDYKADPAAQLQRVESFVGKQLFDSYDLDLGSYNRAARTRFPRLARLTYRFLRSRGALKRALRNALPHQTATRLRHAALNFNRVEASYPPLSQETAERIRQQLSSDTNELIEIVGRVPWASNASPNPGNLGDLEASIERIESRRVAR